MKVLLGMLLVGVMATSAFAVVDTDSDMLGLYFDTSGDQVCGVIAFTDTAHVYLTYTNPSTPFCRGFECTVTSSNPSVFTAITYYPINVVDVAPAPTNFIVGFSAPMPTTPATVLGIMKWQNFGGTAYLSIGPSAPSSNTQGLPMVLDEFNNAMTVGFSTIDGTNAARIDAAPGVCDVVPSEDASWGEVKSLFR